MLYSYEARDKTGQTVTGSLEAPTERVAAQQILSLGYFILRISPIKNSPKTSSLSLNGYGAVPALDPNVWHVAKPLSLWQRFLRKLIYPVWSGVGLRDLAVLYRQFSVLVKAGVPMYQSLTTLTVQTSNQKLRRCLQVMASDIQSGQMLSVSMARYPWIFADFHRAMVIAGEEGGDLDQMFARLATAMEEEYSLRSTIKRETLMPGFTVAASFLLPPLFLLFLGQVRGYFEVALMPFVQLGAIIGFIYVITRLASQFKVLYDGLIAGIPAIGGVVRMIALARFARTLAALYAAGVRITDGLRYSAAACGNSYLGQRMLKAIPYLESGDSIVQALGRTLVFPALVMSMLDTGEQTGSLDSMMENVAVYYEQESKFRLHQLCVSLGVIATIGTGIRVLIIVLQFYTGYFNNITNIDAH